MNKTDLISVEKTEKPFVELNRSQFVTGSQKHCAPTRAPFRATQPDAAGE